MTVSGDVFTAYDPYSADSIIYGRAENHVQDICALASPDEALFTATDDQLFKNVGPLEFNDRRKRQVTLQAQYQHLLNRVGDLTTQQNSITTMLEALLTMFDKTQLDNDNLHSDMIDAIDLDRPFTPYRSRSRRTINEAPNHPAHQIRRQEFNEFVNAFLAFRDRILNSMATIASNFRTLSIHNTALENRQNAFQRAFGHLHTFVHGERDRIRRDTTVPTPQETATAITTKHLIPVLTARKNLQQNVFQFFGHLDTLLQTFPTVKSRSTRSVNMTVTFVTDNVTKVIADDQDYQTLNDSTTYQQLHPDFDDDLLLDDTEDSYDYANITAYLVNQLANNMTYGEDFYVDTNMESNSFPATLDDLQSLETVTETNLTQLTRQHNDFEIYALEYMENLANNQQWLKHALSKSIVSTSEVLELAKNSMVARLDDQVKKMRQNRVKRSQYFQGRPLSLYSGPKTNGGTMDDDLRQFYTNALANALGIPDTSQSTTDEEDYRRINEMLTSLQEEEEKEDQQSPHNRQDQPIDRPNLIYIHTAIFPTANDFIQTFAKAMNITSDVMTPLNIIQTLAKANITDNDVEKAVAAHVPMPQEEPLPSVVMTTPPPLGREKRSLGSLVVMITNAIMMDKIRKMNNSTLNLANMTPEIRKKKEQERKACLEKKKKLEETLANHVKWAKTLASQIDIAQKQPQFVDVRPDEYKKIQYKPELTTDKNKPTEFLVSPDEVATRVVRSKRDLANPDKALSRPKRIAITLILSIIGVIAAITIPPAVQLGVDAHISAVNNERIAARQAENYKALGFLLTRIEELSATQMSLFKQVNVITTLLTRNGFDARSATAISRDIASNQFDLKDKKVRARMIAVLDRARRNHNVKGLVKQWTEKSKRSLTSLNSLQLANKTPRPSSVYTLEELLKFPLTPNQVRLHRKYIDLKKSMNASEAAKQQMYEMEQIHLRVMKALSQQQFKFRDMPEEDEQRTTYYIPFMVVIIVALLIISIAAAVIYYIVKVKQHWTPVPVNP